MLPVTKIKTEGEPADGSRRGGGYNGRSRTVFFSGGFHRQTLSPTHHCVSGLPSHLIWLGHMDISHFLIAFCASGVKRAKTSAGTGHGKEYEP